MIFVQVRRQLDGHDEVCGVTSSGERSGSSDCLVNWTRVDTSSFWYTIWHWNQVHCCHVCVQLLWTGLGKLKRDKLDDNFCLLLKEGLQLIP